MTDFVAGYLAGVYIGAYDWTTQMKSADPTAEREIIDTPTLRTRAKRVFPGQHSASIDLEGYWYWSQDAGVTDGPEEFFARMLTSSQRLPITLTSDGEAIGDRAKCMKVYKASYNPVASTDDVIRFTVSLTGDDGMDFGLLAHALAAETASATSTAVDLHAGEDLTAVYTTGRAYLHVFSASASDTLDIDIEHSDDDGGTDPYATAASFTQIDDEGYEVITIAALKRYARVKSTIVGASPSFSYVVAICPLP
jgi:hypothetical protein